MLLMAVVAVAAVTIAGIGFLGSYTAVRELAIQQGFGRFSTVFPIGIDVGIIALLALDLLLSWLRIPFPLLRQTAWLLTVATIAMNAASAWPRPLGVGMHAVIPLLFVVIAEAGRHAISRLAKLSDSRRMESVRLMRWVLSPTRTFAMWRRMMLWEIRSVDEAIRLEQMRLAYAMLLEDAYGKKWARTAPRSTLLPLRLAKLGVPIYDTAHQGLAAGGLSDSAFGSLFTAPRSGALQNTAEQASAPACVAAHASPEARVLGAGLESHLIADTLLPHRLPAGAFVPAGDELGGAELRRVESSGYARADDETAIAAPAEAPAAASPTAAEEPSGPAPELGTDVVIPVPAGREPVSAAEEGQSREDQLFVYYCHYVDKHGEHPEKHHFADFIFREFGQTGQSGTGPISVQSLRRYWGNLEARFRTERSADEGDLTLTT
jgi:hypothetical protein